MTRYVFAYDLEDTDLCLRATPRLVELHRRYEIPATFFVLGTVLERCGAELRAVFGDDPLFDIASHTYSHRPLKHNRIHGQGVDLDELQREVGLGLQLVEEVFQRPCVGVRSPYGFYGGLRGEKERLKVIWDSGARYLSSDLRGPADSVPGGLAQAYWYDEEGLPELLELPGHGWHDNVLKGFYPGPWLAWPPVLRWGIPDRIPRTPGEEFAVQRTWVEHALALGLDYVSPVYHPHSIYRLTPECSIVEFLMRYVRQRGMAATTYGALYEAYSALPETVPGRDAWAFDL
ncbi:MAG: polysaccharide deacetylase family protein [Actinomycetota bacterium]|nr:polysaccharide deacetylase family protein [Actinomycetota bacterium]